MKRSDFDPRRQPERIRICLAGIPAAAFLWCCAANMGSSLPELLFYDLPIHLLAALVIDGILLVISVLVSKASHSGASDRLAQLYDAAGYCDEMAECLRASAASNERDKVLRAFILVMAEQYEEAEAELGRIMPAALSERESAMLMTAKLRLFMMTMRFDRAEHLLANEQNRLDGIYAREPDFSAEYCPYADDALDYFTLSAAFCDLTQQPEQAEHYRSMAKERVMSCSQTEKIILLSLQELNRLYAAGEQESAYKTECELMDLAETLTAAAGRKNELRRRIGQAKIFSRLRAFAKPALKNERQLPPESAAPLPPELINM